MPSLKRNLKTRLNTAKRVAIVGIGSALRGDDALGLRLIEDIKARRRLMQGPQTVPVRLYACDSAPENFTGRIKRFRPTHIVIVDAASLGKKAGAARIVGFRKTDAAVSFSTHNLSLKILADYLRWSLDCRIIPVGIQPASLEFGTPLSKKVEASLRRISEAIVENIPLRVEKNNDRTDRFLQHKAKK